MLTFMLSNITHGIAEGLYYRYSLRNARLNKSPMLCREIWI